MKEIQFNSIVFVKGNDLSKGYFFYKSALESDNGRIVGLTELTLPIALWIMKTKGIDIIKDSKWNINVYYGP